MKYSNQLPSIKEATKSAGSSVASKKTPSMMKSIMTQTSPGFLGLSYSKAHNASPIQNESQSSLPRIKVAPAEFQNNFPVQGSRFFQGEGQIAQNNQKRDSLLYDFRPEHFRRESLFDMVRINGINPRRDEEPRGDFGSMLNQSQSSIHSHNSRPQSSPSDHQPDKPFNIPLGLLYNQLHDSRPGQCQNQSAVLYPPQNLNLGCQIGSNLSHFQEQSLNAETNSKRDIPSSKKEEFQENLLNTSVCPRKSSPFKEALEKSFIQTQRGQDLTQPNQYAPNSPRCSVSMSHVTSSGLASPRSGNSQRVSLSQSRNRLNGQSGDQISSKSPSNHSEGLLTARESLLRKSNTSTETKGESPHGRRGESISKWDILYVVLGLLFIFSMVLSLKAPEVPLEDLSPFAFHNGTTN